MSNKNANNSITDSEYSDRTKKITANSLVLFVRIFFITAITLYSVRYILKGLGEVDYGIYNAVANVVLTGSCIIPVLALSIQRFYSFFLGKKDERKVKEIFSVSINIVFVLSVVTIIVFETLGVYLLNNYMTIPEERMQVAQWALQLSILSFIFMLMQIPFTAAIFSHEDMGIYAIVSAIDCLLKFIIAYFIKDASFDHIIFYASGLVLTSFVIFIVYVLVCVRKYDVCRYSLKHHDADTYKGILTFSGWTFFGSMANVGLIQGSTILLNIFFGPIANAAFGIANNVYNAFNSLTNSIILPFRPAMIKAYSEDKLDFLKSLFVSNNKLIMYLLITVSLPLIAEMNDILSVWLQESTRTMVLFSRLFIIYCMFLAMHNPITTIIHATGKMRNYSLSVESFTLMNVPVVWLLFHFGAPSYAVFLSMIGLCVIAHFVRLQCLKNSFDRFSYREYFMSIVIPGAIITVIVCLVTAALYFTIENRILRFILVMTIVPLSSLLSIYLIGINNSERQQIRKLLLKFL